MSKRSASELSVDEQQQPQSKQRREENNKKTVLPAATANSSTSSSSHSMNNSIPDGGQDTIMNENNQPPAAAAAAAESSSFASSSSSSSSSPLPAPIRVCGIDVWHCEQLRHDMTQLLLNDLALRPSSPSSSIGSSLLLLVNHSIQTQRNRVLDINRGQLHEQQLYTLDDTKWVKVMIRAGGIQALVLKANENSDTQGTHTKAASSSSTPASSSPSRIARNLLEHHFGYSTIAAISRRSLSGKLESLLESFLISDLANIVVEYESPTDEEEIEIAKCESEIGQINIQNQIEEEGVPRPLALNFEAPLDAAAAVVTSAKASIAALTSRLTQFVGAATTMAEIASAAAMATSALADAVRTGAAAALTAQYSTPQSSYQYAPNIYGDQNNGHQNQRLQLESIYNLESSQLAVTLASLPQPLAQAIVTRDVAIDAARLVELLSHQSVLLKCGVLRIILYVTHNASVSLRRRFIDSNMIQCLKGLIVHRMAEIRHDSILLVSRLTHELSEDFEVAFYAQLKPMLVSTLHDKQMEVQTVASLALCLALKTAANDSEVRELADAGIIPLLCSKFDESDAKTILIALDGIEHILRVGKKDAQSDPQRINAYAALVEGCKGLDYLEALQQHENESVYIKAVQILQTYFVSPEEEEEYIHDEQGLAIGQFTFNPGM